MKLTTAWLRAAAAVLMLALGGAVLLAAPWAPDGSHAAPAPVSVFPIVGGHFAAPATQLTFRGVPASQLGAITVTGSVSGAHSGRIESDSDGQGASFIPDKPFAAGETVTVHSTLNVIGASSGTYSFTIANPAGPIKVAPNQKAPRVRGDVDRFVSAGGLIPAAMHVIKAPHRAAPGFIFVAPQAGPVQYGPEILGPYGGLIWFHPIPKGDSATDFRVQSYQGKPVLTWWQGTVNGGVGTGEDEIYNSSYQQVATVHAGNGLRSDLHEFQLTSQNTALVSAYYPVYVDASSIKGGSKHQLVLDSVVQEIDIPTGLVLYQWDSLDHVPLNASHQPVTAVKGHPWDYFHVNSIQEDTDGTLIISARNTWSIYKVSHQNGAIIWTLGGRYSTFKMGHDTQFIFQHDARIQPGDGKITIFDDGAGPPVVHKRSRGLTLDLNPSNYTATLDHQDEHVPGLLAEYEGSVQPQPNGDQLVGWGEQPYVTEFNANGRPVFDARFVGQNSSYRAYRFYWSATPANQVGVGTRVSHGRTTVYASWNGATNVARWRILGGSSPKSLKGVAGGRKTAFETAIRIPHHEAYVATQALDGRGKVLGTSKAIKVG